MKLKKKTYWVSKDALLTQHIITLYKVDSADKVIQDLFVEVRVVPILKRKVTKS